MNFMIPETDRHNYQNLRRKVTAMTTDMMDRTPDTNADELMKLRREKRRERRRRQMSAFFESVSSQNTDKVILLFSNEYRLIPCNSRRVCYTGYRKSKGGIP